MAVNHPNTIGAGAVVAVDCPPCGCSAPDPIRAGLVAGGVSAADLAKYDAAGEGSYIALTGVNTTAALTTLRNAMLSAVTGSYRIGNTDALFNTAPSGGTANAMAGVAGTALADGQLQAGTAPILVMVNVRNANGLCIIEPRKGTHAYTTVAGTNLAGGFGVWTGPMAADLGVTGLNYACWVFKRPTFTDGVDRNTAMHYTTTIGTNSGANQIGTTRTALTTSNLANRIWQIIAGNPDQWPCN